MTPSTPALLIDARSRKSLAKARLLVEQALALLDEGSLDLSVAAQLQEALDRIVAAGTAAELPSAA